MRWSRDEAGGMGPAVWAGVVLGVLSTGKLCTGTGFVFFLDLGR